MKVWITSDLHFSHGNILKFNPATRPFNDAEHMNAEMTRMWNERIQPEDLVYILGDVAFCNAAKATAIVRGLNGRKILIEGNHDRKLLDDAKFRACFEAIHVYHEINHAGTKVCLFHYPIYDHNKAAHGSIMLHGHRHGNPTGLPGRIKDVGMDATGEIAVELDHVVSQLLTVDPIVHHPPR